MVWSVCLSGRGTIWHMLCCYTHTECARVIVLLHSAFVRSFVRSLVPPFGHKSVSSSSSSDATRSFGRYVCVENVHIVHTCLLGRPQRTFGSPCFRLAPTDGDWGWKGEGEGEAERVHCTHTERTARFRRRRGCVCVWRRERERESAAVRLRNDLWVEGERNGRTTTTNRIIGL